MAKQETPFIGGAYEARDKNLNAQLCQNLYVEIDQSGAKNIIALVNTPGTVTWYDPGYFGEVRALHIFKTNLYAVIGNRLYRIDEGGAGANLGTLANSTGYARMEDNSVDLMILDNNLGYVWNGATLTQIADTDFPDASGLTFQDGYFMVTKTGTDELYPSDADDPTAWDPTQVIAKEGKSDPLVLPYMALRLVWLFGTLTTEIWYNSGVGTFPFARATGGFIEIGLGAKRSVDDLEGVIFFLDHKYRVCQASGISYKPVSTYQIDYQIEKLTRKDDAIGFCYTQEGHSFYQITFPTDSKTFVYDITTGFWHTRASGALDKRERANCHIRFAEKELVGDFENGKIYYYDLTTYTDNGDVKRAIRSAQAVNKNRRWVRHHSFELEIETGSHLSTGQGSDPQIMMQYSDDNGTTWSAELWRSMGKIGEKGIVVRWNKLGGSRDRIYKIVIADPVRREITNCYLDGSVGRS